MRKSAGREWRNDFATTLEPNDELRELLTGLPATPRTLRRGLVPALGGLKGLMDLTLREATPAA